MMMIATPSPEASAEHTDQLLNDKQVQDLTGIPTGTLRWWRHQGDQGPIWFRLGPRAIRYKSSDVVAWIEDNYRAGASS